MNETHKSKCCPVSLFERLFSLTSILFRPEYPRPNNDGPCFMVLKMIKTFVTVIVNGGEQLEPNTDEMPTIRFSMGITII